MVLHEGIHTRPVSLRFPDPGVQTTGPFIFQAKFVEEANAAGAKPNTALISSGSKEATRIIERIKKHRWKEPTHFTFVTNSLVDARVREKIRTASRRYVGKETDRRWEQGEDLSLVEFKTVEYEGSKQVAASDEIKQQILKT